MAPTSSSKRSIVLEKSQQSQTTDGSSSSRGLMNAVDSSSSTALDKNRFCLVKFIGEPRTPVFVVPNVWIHFDVGETLCYWPIRARGKKLEDAVRSRLQPDLISKAWKAKHIAIKYRNDTWEKCDAKLESYIKDNDTSGIDTEVGLPDSDVDEHSPIKKKIKGNSSGARARKPPGFKSRTFRSNADSDSDCSDSNISCDSRVRSMSESPQHINPSGSREKIPSMPNEKQGGNPSSLDFEDFEFGNGDDDSVDKQETQIELIPAKPTSPNASDDESNPNILNKQKENLNVCQNAESNANVLKPTENLNVCQNENKDSSKNSGGDKKTEKSKKKKKSSQEVLQEAILRRRQHIENALKENTEAFNLMRELHQDRGPDKVVDGVIFPIADPDKLRELEAKLLHSKKDRETLCAYLKSKGKASSTTSECCEITMSSLMTTLCGFFVNFRGNKCKEGEVISDCSKKIGMEKAMPTLVAVIEATFRDVCSEDKPGITPKCLSKAAVKWLSKRKERMEKKNVEIPPLP